MICFRFRSVRSIVNRKLYFKKRKLFTSTIFRHMGELFKGWLTVFWMVAQKSSVYALTHINTCWQFTSVISRPMWPISLIFHHKWSRSKLQSCIWKLRLWSQNTHSKSFSVQVRNTLIKVIGDVPGKQTQIKGLVYFWWKDKLLPSTKQKSCRWWPQNSFHD